MFQLVAILMIATCYLLSILMIVIYDHNIFIVETSGFVISIMTQFGQYEGASRVDLYLAQLLAIMNLFEVSML